MPQIDRKHVKDFISYLNKRDIGVTKKKVDPEKLKATQHQFHKAKVQSLIDYIESGNYDNKRIIVSKDNYVMDGHHRWLAHNNTDKDINIYQVNVNAKDLLDLMHEYPKSYTEKLYGGTIQ
jgi:ParB-like chromosome segregation protein Spo0J